MTDRERDLEAALRAVLDDFRCGVILPDTIEQAEAALANGELFAAPEAIAPGFDAFYQDYPRHIGKAAARRAWTSATKRAPAALIAAKARAFSADCANKGTEPKFIPHPATWLNGDRWLDEPDRQHGADAFLNFASAQNGGDNGVQPGIGNQRARLR